MKLKKITDGVLYRNPSPGIKAECAYLPNVVPLSETEILCFYRIGSAFYSADGKIAKLRSTDGGNSWKTEGLVWEPAGDRAPFSYTAPHASRLRDGTLVLVASRRDGSDPDRPTFNPETGGSRMGDPVLFRSHDDGRTWSEPQVLDLPGDITPDMPSQIIELNNGRWLLICEAWKEWADPSPLHIKGYAAFSDDEGKSWKEKVDLPVSSDKMYSHSRFTRMLDGRVAALQWTQKVGTGEDYDLHFTISDDTGTRWSRPLPTGLTGQTSWLADLGNGKLAATYTMRERMKPGICVVLSEDSGASWDVENQVMVWDAVGQEFLGVVQKPSYPASHDNIAFGKPNTSRLSNGQIMSSWWCTQACVTHTRFARLTLE